MSSPIVFNLPTKPSFLIKHGIKDLILAINCSNCCRNMLACSSSVPVFMIAKRQWKRLEWLGAGTCVGWCS